MGHGGVFLGSVVCLFSAIVLGMKVSDQVRADTAPAQGRGTAQYAREGGGLPEAE